MDCSSFLLPYTLSIHSGGGLSGCTRLSSPLPSLGAPPLLAFCSISAISEFYFSVFQLKICCRDNVYCCHIILLFIFFFLFLFCARSFVNTACLSVSLLFFSLSHPFFFGNWKCLMLPVIVSTNFSFFLCVCVCQRSFLI